MHRAMVCHLPSEDADPPTSLHDLVHPYSRRLPSDSDTPLPAIVSLPRVMRLVDVSYLPLLRCTPHLTELQLHVPAFELVALELLPSSLVRLDMGIFFDQPLQSGQLQHLKRLSYLCFPGRFNKPLPSNVFPRLHSLSFAGCAQQAHRPSRTA